MVLMKLLNIKNIWLICFLLYVLSIMCIIFIILFIDGLLFKLDLVVSNLLLKWLKKLYVLEFNVVKFIFIFCLCYFLMF